MQFEAKSTQLAKEDNKWKNNHNDNDNDSITLSNYIHNGEQMSKGTARQYKKEYEVLQHLLWKGMVLPLIPL